VKLNDNFQSGLRQWEATPVKVHAGASAADWSFNHGFAQPGRLRLWKESLSMSDYQMEFVSQIEKRGVGWAYRASDEKNYYAEKIQIMKPGPLPRADLIRYAVVDGVEGGRVSIPVPLNLRPDTLYRVLVTVKGSSFSTQINGQMVDSWSDKRLKAGGVGFFADLGEVASLRWVTVTHRDDMVGRLLSYMGFLQPLEPEVYLAILPAL
jgi:hypothetical protein